MIRSQPNCAARLNMKQKIASGAILMTSPISFIETSNTPSIADFERAVWAFSTSSKPMPKNSAKNITARMSFSLIAWTKLIGMMAMSESMPGLGFDRLSRRSTARPRCHRPAWRAPRRIDPGARLEQVDHRQADRDRDRRDDHGIDQRADADRTQRADLAHFGYADDQRRDDQRDDQHEQQAQEDLADAAR